MSETATGSQTVVGAESQPSPTPVLKLKLKKPPPTRRVQWTDDTIDNEHMNKKKSKCCCVYKKPLQFGESDSEDSDSDCDHCSHHKSKDYVSSKDPSRATVDGTVREGGEEQNGGDQKDKDTHDQRNGNHDVPTQT